MSSKANKRMEKIAGRLVKVIIQRIEDVKTDWKQPWLYQASPAALPQNINGRHYRGGNVLMLLMNCMVYRYTIPVFITFKEAEKRGILIRKGAESFPVWYYMYKVIHRETGEEIDFDLYRELGPEEKEDYKVIAIIQWYNVFNLEQTNYPERFPDRWKKLLDKFRPKDEIEKVRTCTLKDVDQYMEEGQWVCPIHFRYSDRAYYSPAWDHIVHPLKDQFYNEEIFYTTLFHEITHSTGYVGRLDRITGIQKSSREYAVEELIAEFTTSLVCFMLGINSTIREDNIAYLDHWLKQLKEKPVYLMEILNDVVNAYNFMEKYMPFLQNINNRNEKIEVPELEVEEV